MIGNVTQRRTIIATLLWLGVISISLCHAADRGTLEKAIQRIEASPEAALALVRKHVIFRPYQGFVKGPQGSWTDGTANTLDAADLLLYILNRKGIEARLATGKLVAERGNSLLKRTLSSVSLVKDVQDKLPGTELADPAKEEELAATLSNHWWVKVRKGDIWVDLDPFFPDLKPGEIMTESAEEFENVDMNLCRNLRIEVFAKDAYEEAPRIVLSFENPIRDLFDKKIVLLTDIPDSEDSGTSVQPGKMKPMLLVGDEIVTGDVFSSDSAPGSQTVASGFANVFDIADEPQAESRKQGTVLEYAFVSVGLVGGAKEDRFEKRYLYLGGESGLNRLNDLTVMGVFFGAATHEKHAESVNKTRELEPLVRDFKLPDKSAITPDQRKRITSIITSASDVAYSTAQTLATNSHLFLMRLDEAFGTISDYNDARILSVSINPVLKHVSSDLVFDSVISFARQGTKVTAPVALIGLRGQIGADFERDILASLGKGKDLSRTRVVSVSDIFQSAYQAKIPPLVLCSEKPELTDQVECEPWIKQILTERVAAGYILMLPQKPVRLAASAEPILAWYQIDRRTGEWTGVFQDGRHQGFAEYKELRETMALGAGWVGSFLGNFAGTLMGYYSDLIPYVDADPATYWKAHQAALANAASFDWFGGYMEVMSAVITVVTWDPGKVALFYSVGQSLAYAGKQAAVLFLKDQMKPSHPYQRY